MSTINRLCSKRLLGDMKLLKKDPHEYIETFPNEENVLEWFFLVNPPEFSDFKNGYFIGKIIFGPNYPMQAPDFMMLTPNGRFMTDRKICLSNSSYHSNEWTPMWNIKAILTGFLSIMLDDNENGISHIHSSKQEREYLSAQSVQFNIDHYPNIIKKFTRFLDEKGQPKKEEKDESVKKEDESVKKKVVKKKPATKRKTEKDTENKPTTKKKTAKKTTLKKIKTPD